MFVTHDDPPTTAGEGDNSHAGSPHVASHRPGADPRAARCAGRGPVRRPGRRSVHRPLLVALPASARPGPRRCQRPRRARSRPPARAPRAAAADAAHRRRRNAQPAPATGGQRPRGGADRCRRRDPRLHRRSCGARPVPAGGPVVGRRLERSLRGHQRHRHLRSRTAGADHLPGRAFPQPAHPTVVLGQPRVRSTRQPAGGAGRVVHPARAVAAGTVPHHRAGQLVGQGDRGRVFPAAFRARLAAALPRPTRICRAVQRGPARDRRRRAHSRGEPERAEPAGPHAPIAARATGRGRVRPVGRCLARARHGERRGGVAAAHAPGPSAVRPAARAPPAPGHRCHASIATRAGRARPVPAGRGPAHRLPPRPARVRARRAAAAARRDRHRQGSLRPRRAPRQPPCGAAVRRGQLRGDSRDPDRERAVRLPRRQLHRRAPGRHARQAAAGRRRHAVPR